MITLVDYGIGNLRSLEKAFHAVGVDVLRTRDTAAIRRASRLVLPGVGAFGACVDTLRGYGLEAPLRAAVADGVPLLGVCVGMQMLFETGREMGTHDGLGFLEGEVIRFADGMTEDDEDPLSGTLTQRTLKVPHMGWSALTPTTPTPLLDGLDAGTHVYFVHSYHAAPARPTDVLATAHYGQDFPAVVGRGRVFGAQFHPEKSQHAGLRLLRNFATMTF